MRCAKCAYCVNAKVEEDLQEDAFGFEYVEKTLTCISECEPESDYECSGFKSFNSRVEVDNV